MHDNVSVGLDRHEMEILYILLIDIQDGSLDQAKFTDIQITEVIDLVDAPYCAVVAVSFDYDGYNMQGTTYATRAGAGDWELQGELIADIEWCDAPATTNAE